MFAVCKSLFGSRREAAIQIVAKLVELRKTRGLSCVDVDRVCTLDGIEYPKCADFEADPAKIDGRTIERISEFLEIPLHELIDVNASGFLDKEQNLDTVYRYARLIKAQRRFPLTSKSYLRHDLDLHNLSEVAKFLAIMTIRCLSRRGW